MRILKFDTIHPVEYLRIKQEEWKDEIPQLSRKEYLNKVLALRSNFSDFYTSGWQKSGWQAEEFLAFDDIYLDKVAKEVFGSKLWFNKQKNQLLNKLRPVELRWQKQVMAAYIHQFKPDVIFVREDTRIPSDFWRWFGGQALLVSRIACDVPRQWHHKDWDLVYTSTKEYVDFFTLNKIPTLTNSNGFAPRILTELEKGDKRYEVSFVGGLNPYSFVTRTNLMSHLAQHLNFVWWGHGGEVFKSSSPLAKTWQGHTSGLAMFQIYHDSCIVANDYIDMAANQAVNQRIFEVMGVGTLLLTREAANLSKMFPKDLFITYTNEKDCVDKAQYFLKNEAEREEIAAKGQQFILENYSYDHLMKTMSEELKNAYQNKFNKPLH